MKVNDCSICIWRRDDQSWKGLIVWLVTVVIIIGRPEHEGGGKRQWTFTV